MSVSEAKAFEANSGLKVTDDTGDDGPLYTGGTASPVGLALPRSSIYAQNIGDKGIILWRKWGVGNNDWSKISYNDFHQTEIDLSETSNTSNTTYVTKLSMTTPSLPAGKYRLAWSYRWRALNANRGIEIRTRVDGTPIADCVQFTPNVDAMPCSSAFTYLNLTSGAHTFIMDFRGSIGSSTYYMSEAHMEFWRVE